MVESRQYGSHTLASLLGWHVETEQTGESVLLDRDDERDEVLRAWSWDVVADRLGQIGGVEERSARGERHGEEVGVGERGRDGL